MTACSWGSRRAASLINYICLYMQPACRVCAPVCMHALQVCEFFEVTPDQLKPASKRQLLICLLTDQRDAWCALNHCFNLGTKLISNLSETLQLCLQLIPSATCQPIQLLRRNCRGYVSGSRLLSHLIRHPSALAQPCATASCRMQFGHTRARGLCSSSNCLVPSACRWARAIGCSPSPSVLPLSLDTALSSKVKVRCTFRGQYGE